MKLLMFLIKLHLR